MKKLTDEEFLTKLNALRKKHKTEEATVIAEGAIGRTTTEVAALIGTSQNWVRGMLQHYAVACAASVSVGGPAIPKTPEVVMESSGYKRDRVRTIDAVIKKHKPIQPDEVLVREYEEEGHLPATARLLASSFEAGQKAVDAGEIKEDKDKMDRRIGKIILPAETDWEMKIRRIASDLKSAAKLLDEAQISDLKRAATRKRIAPAHALWMEQVERLRNFHPTFDEEVEAHGTT